MCKLKKKIWREKNLWKTYSKSEKKSELKSGSRRIRSDAASRLKLTDAKRSTNRTAKLGKLVRFFILGNIRRNVDVAQNPMISSDVGFVLFSFISFPSFINWPTIRANGTATVNQLPNRHSTHTQTRSHHHKMSFFFSCRSACTRYNILYFHKKNEKKSQSENEREKSCSNSHQQNESKKKIAEVT